MKLSALLRKLRVYGDVPIADAEALQAAASRKVLVAKGTEFVQQGSSQDESCLLLKGLVGKFFISLEGERHIVALHVDGDFVDLPSLFLKPSDHSLMALTDCEIVFFPHAKLLRVVEDHPRLALTLWNDTLVDGAVTQEWVALMTKPADQRFAHLICEMYLRMRRVGLADDWTFKLPLTQETFGEVLGLSSVHINRVIKPLRQTGIISLRGQNITIHNWKALIKVAEFNGAYLKHKLDSL